MERPEGDEGLIGRVGRLAAENERTYTGCSQAVVGAFREILGDEAVSESVFKAATGLAGGCGNTGNLCGAVAGGAMVLGLFVGRDFESWNNKEKIFESFRPIQELVEAFKGKYWSVNCAAIQEKLMGQHFYTDSPGGQEAFERARGPEHCSDVVRTAAEKVMEILLREGLVNGRE